MLQYVASGEQYIEFWRHPGTIQVGDFFVAISKKYQYQGETIFLGDTYTQCTVMESEDLGERRFRVKAATDKRIEFLDKGLLFSMGLSEQIITLDGAGKIQSFHVVKSVSSIVGGTGELQQYENGLYKLETIGDHLFLATITSSSKDSKDQSMLVITTIIIIIISLLVLLK